MKITIVTASFNSASTIDLTLRTVSEQTHPDIEHVVVDGGSKDNTLAIVRAHGKRVCQVVSEPDRGTYDAMNKGLALSTGEVVGFLNSDDFYPAPDVISRVASAFAADPTLDAVYGDLCYVKQFETDAVVRYWRSCDYQPGLFLRGWAPPHPTVFVRKRVYDRLGGFNLVYHLASDWDLLARLFEVNRIHTRYMPGVLVHMRLGGITNRSWGNVWKQNKEIWRAATAHGLHLSLGGFALGKLWSRGRQFLTREA